MPKSLKLLLGVLTSSLCLFALFQYAASFDFKTLFLDINYVYLAPLLLSVSLAQGLIGCRFFLLLEKKVPLRLALSFSVLGNSANLILPFRGGELLKAYLSQKASSLGYISILSRIFFERSLDLGFALSLGALALGLSLLDPNPGQKNEYAWTQKIFILLLLLGLLIPAGLFIIKNKLDILLSLLKKLAAPFGKAHFIEGRLSKELYSLQSFLSWSNIYRPLLLSALIWSGAHVLCYISAAAMQSLEISYLDTLFLLFAAAMAFLLPSAPSGIGVLHASLSSALVFMGYPIEKALAYALLNHFCISLTLGILGLCSWLYLNRLQKQKRD